jgi:hypothetical protein
MKFKTNVSDKIYWGFGVAFLGIYFGIIYQNTFNIPHWDDFDVFFQFLCNYIESSSFTEKLKLIFEQHNVHRIVFTKIAALLSYWITGKINLVVFIIIGNLFLLGIGAMFFNFLKQKKNAGIFALIIILLLYNGQNFETSTWAMAGLANVGTLMLSMSAIYFVLQPGKSYFITGIILSVIAIFSNGNGMCLFPAVLLSLFLQKRTKNLIWFAIVTGIAVICYFFNLELNSEHGSRYIPDILKAFFCFLGGNLWLPSVKIVAFLLGLFIFATYVLALVGKFYKKNIAWFTFFTFVLLTAAMVSLNRPADEIAPLRYRIFCCMGTILTVMFYYENSKVFHKYVYTLHWFRFIIIFSAILFSMFCSLVYLNRTKKSSEFRKISTYNWQHSKSGLDYYSTSGADIFALQRVEKLDIYTMPKLPLKNMESTVEITGGTWQNHNSRIFYNIDFVEETSEYVLIKGWAYTDEMGMDFTDIYLRLFSENQSIKIHPYAERRYEIPLLLSRTIRENCGFFAVIPKTALTQGAYKLGIEIQKRYIVPIKKSTKAINTDIQIRI